MKPIEASLRVISTPLVLTGILSVALSAQALAFPKITPIPAFSVEDTEASKVLDTATGESNGQQLVSRAPMIMKIGTRSQLFDGDFQCVVSDQAPYLKRVSRQF